MKKFHIDEDVDSLDFFLRCDKTIARRAFKDVIAAASRNQSLVCGVHDAIEVFHQEDSDNVKLCILAKSEDPADQVYSRLIEAYCLEKRIPTVTVNCGITLTSLINRDSEEVFNCVLMMDVQEIQEMNSAQMLFKYIKSMGTRSVLKIS